MSRSLLTLLLSILLVSAAWAQEEASAGDVEEPETAEAVAADDSGEVGEPEAPGEADEADVAEEADQIVDPDFDDAALDVQTYEEDDDDFVPSEEIPADEPIPFPSNI